MVKNEDSNVPAEETAKKVTRSRAPKKADTDTPAVEKKSLIKKPAKAKAEKSPASVDEVVEKATKKAPKKDVAKRGAKAKDDSAQTAEIKAPAVVAPVSATSLMFMAPDLPTPKVSAKGIASDKNSDDSHLRRRSRRRAGEAVDVDPNAAPNVVVKVRTPREPKAPSNEPTRVKGSTRLEAKKQRRRDGRDAGRRRTTITESEFLARREAVDRTMVVRSKDGKIQIGVLEDGILVEHYVAKAAEASLIGNVYLGKVQNVLPLSLIHI
jgi:ribonuclease E